MPPSERYITMAAVLDDPLNRAIAERELARRQKPFNRGFVPPPIPRAGGGFVILSMREYQRFPTEKLAFDAQVDHLAEVFHSSDGWWVALADGSEVGPFPATTEALTNATSILSDEGYEFLPDFPWTAQDAEEYPFTNTLL